MVNVLFSFIYHSMIKKGFYIMMRSGSITLLLILIVGSSFGRAADKITVGIDATQAVKPVAASMLQAKPDNERSVQLAQAYYDSIAKWGEVLWDHLEQIPDHDDVTAASRSRPRSVSRTSR